MHRKKYMHANYYSYFSLSLLFIYVSASYPQSFSCFCAHMNSNGHLTISLLWCDSLYSCGRDWVTPIPPPSGLLPYKSECNCSWCSTNLPQALSCWVLSRLTWSCLVFQSHCDWFQIHGEELWKQHTSLISPGAVVASIDRGRGLDSELWSLRCVVFVFNLCLRWLSSADCRLLPKSKARWSQDVRLIGETWISRRFDCEDGCLSRTSANLSLE